jgi:hypothetical protein
MPVFCLLTLDRHGNFTAEVTMEQPDLLCTALALNIELLSIIVCAVLNSPSVINKYSVTKYFFIICFENLHLGIPSTHTVTYIPLICVGHE